MKFPSSQTVKELAKIVNAHILGDENLLISGSNEIHRIQEGELVFVDHPKYYDKALNSAASCVLINAEAEVPKGKALLVVDEPFTAFNKINLHFRPHQYSDLEISKSAKIGQGTQILPNVTIGENVVIGENCLIHANVSIGNDTIIGNNVTIHSGTVLGGDGFYFKNRGDSFEKLESVGKVVIEDHVEIGANCTIDRGVTAETRIGAQTKLDNLVQIGHDTVIGKHCLLAAQVAVAGCCNIGNDVILWGQVGVKANITIEDKVEVYAQSGIGKTLKEGHKYFGSPAEEAQKMMQTLVKIRRL